LRKPFNGKSMAAAISAACAVMERKRQRAAPIAFCDLADRAVAEGAK
jgi:hypothetical protein